MRNERKWTGLEKGRGKWQYETVSISLHHLHLRLHDEKVIVAVDICFCAS